MLIRRSDILLLLLLPLLPPTVQGLSRGRSVAQQPP